MNVHSASNSSPPSAPPFSRDGSHPRSTTAPKAPRSAGGSLTPGSEAHALRILLADDDEHALRLAVDTLSSAGLDVHVCASPSEVLERVAAGSHDALIVALEVWGEQGMQLVRELLKRGTALPVVLLARAPALDTAVEALRLGVADYLGKPLEADQLVARVIEATERRHALRALDLIAAQVKRLAALLDGLTSRLSPTVSQQGIAPASAPDVFVGLSRQQLSKLSKRERDVLRALARGHCARDIASTLGLSTNTVRNHIRSLFVKLGVNSQVSLMARLSGGSGVIEESHG